MIVTEYRNFNITLRPINRDHQRTDAVVLTDDPVSLSEAETRERYRVLSLMVSCLINLAHHEYK